MRNEIEEAGVVDAEGQSEKCDVRRYILFPQLKSAAVAIVVIAAFATIGLLSGDHTNATESTATSFGSYVEPAGVTAEDSRILADPTEVFALSNSDDFGHGEAAGTDESAPILSGPEADGDPGGGSSTERGGFEMPAPVASIGSDASDGNEKDATPTTEHQHVWTAETKKVDYPAKYEDVYHEAVFDTKMWTQCNACLGDITGMVSEHMKKHAFAGESASYHTEESLICIQEAWTEYGVLVQEGYSEEVPTGIEVCSCGARR